MMVNRQLKLFFHPMRFSVNLFVFWIFSFSSSISAATWIEAYAHVKDTVNPLNDKTAQQFITRGSGNNTIASGVNVGGGSAYYQVNAGSSSGSIYGQSRKITLSQFNSLHWDSQADAYLTISDRFTISGPITSKSYAQVRVNYQGSLIPNKDFENQYFKQTGQAITTAFADAKLYYGYLDGLGNIVDGRGKNNSYVSLPLPNIPNFAAFFGDGKIEEASVSNGKINFESTLPTGYVKLTEDTRSWGFNLNLSGVGLRGGGFNFSGTGAITPFASRVEPEALNITEANNFLVQAASLGLDSGSFLDQNFFEVVVELSPGLSISGHTGQYIRQVTIVPLPPTFYLFSIALLIGRFISAPRHQSSSL